MNPRRTDPLHLDVAKVAEQGQAFGGSRPLVRFDRLAEMAHPEAQPVEADSVDWRVRGERRAKRGEGLQTWLHLDAHTQIALVCQRCLQPLRLTVDAERSFRFVGDEETAARLDAETDEDVLAISRSFDLLALIEDELLLALPLVPRHSNCRMALPASLSEDIDPLAPASGAASDDPAVHPFAILAGLKGGGRLDD